MSDQSVSDDFVRTVENLLVKGKVSEVKLLFSASENTAKISRCSCELISILIKYLKDVDTNSELFLNTKILLNAIIVMSSAEETVLQILEEIEETDSNIKFEVLLEPLLLVLAKIRKKKSLFLAWALNAVHKYLLKCSIPETANLQGKEKMLLDDNDETKTINEIYKTVLHFYEKLNLDFFDDFEFLEETSFMQLKFLIQLLGSPLMYLDVEIFDDFKSKARLLSESIIFVIFQLTTDPVPLIDNCFNDSDDDLRISKVDLASLYYLVYTEGISVYGTPRVYHPVYFFQKSLFLATTFLKVNHDIVVEKGLKLAMTFLGCLKHIQLSYLLLDSDDHEEFCKALSDVIVYNEKEFLRKLGLNVYTVYLSCFETRGFYLLIYHLMSTITHSGLRGYSITLYKNLVVKEFQTQKDPNEISVYVKGKKLLSLLKRFCNLKNNEESDLADLSDEIIATLNFLRYLTIRDSENITGIWDYLPVIDKTYLQVLRRAIEGTRTSYKFQIMEIEQERDLSKKANLDIVVKGESLSQLSKTEKIQRLNQIWTVFDVIDSILSRLQQCIDAGKIGLSENKEK
ncbi:glomulin-like isoform X1 [Diabrotica undecimpunctata]|uniref:glomulin-like isoform X1 n=1 Tax=Diabrotica undecimpunctata TaxID=50387 RepID=UPI003B6385B1